jgi:hypothetical protein
MPHNPVAGVSNSLDSEIMKVTAVGNDQVGNVALTVERAQKGTTAKSFTAGAIVTNGIYIEDVIPPYSTSETDTGCRWIDGRKIYKKTIDFGALPNATNKKVPHGISNLGTVVRWEGMTTYSGDSVQRPLPFVPTGSSGYVLVEFEPSNIAIYAGSDRTAFSAIITMYYTKTS